jgi:hypothetical protein
MKTLDLEKRKYDKSKKKLSSLNMRGNYFSEQQQQRFPSIVFGVLCKYLNNLIITKPNSF